MLRKISLSLIVCAITTQASALELYKAKILKYTTSTTGNITATCKSTPLNLPMNRDDQYYTFFRTRAEPQSIVLGQPASIKSSHEIYIRNNDESAQEYSIRTSSCVFNNKENTDDYRCAITSYTINIEPNGYFEEDIAPTLHFKATELKPLTLRADIQISRESDSSGSYETSSASSDILVTAN